MQSASLFVPVDVARQLSVREAKWWVAMERVMGRRRLMQ
jgi:hypothetical protein